MTPKLKLNELARNALLSWIRKSRLLGMRRTSESTQMTLAPKTQAAILWNVSTGCGGSGQGGQLTNAAHHTHDPAPGVIAHTYSLHRGCDPLRIGSASLLDALQLDSRPVFVPKMPRRTSKSLVAIVVFVPEGLDTLYLDLGLGLFKCQR